MSRRVLDHRRLANKRAGLAPVGRSEDDRVDSALSLMIEKNVRSSPITNGAIIEDPDTATPAIDLSLGRFELNEE